MADVEITYEKPVSPPVDKVVLTLTESEAVTLLHIVGSIHGDSKLITKLYNGLKPLSGRKGEVVGVRKGDGRLGVYPRNRR